MRSRAFTDLLVVALVTFIGAIGVGAAPEPSTNLWAAILGFALFFGAILATPLLLMHMVASPREPGPPDSRATRRGRCEDLRAATASGLRVRAHPRHTRPGETPPTPLPFGRGGMA